MSNKPRYIGAALLALALCPASEARAGFVSGTELLEICKTIPADAVARQRVAACIGYVVGVADTFNCAEQRLGFTWDNTGHVSQERLVSITVKWLRDHPEYLGYRSDGLVAAALSDAFPCPVKVVRNLPQN